MSPKSFLRLSQKAWCSALKASVLRLKVVRILLAE